MSLAYLNGEFLPIEKAQVSVMDRGFLFADSIYEVIPFYNGKGLGLDAHLQRLANSLAAVEITAPLTADEWKAVFTRLLAEHTGNTKLYLQVTRGASAVRDFVYPDANTSPTVFAFATEFTPGRLNAGCKAITIEDIRWRDCFIKSTNLLPSCMATELAKRHDCEEALLHKHGNLTEGASCNVFVVQNGTVLTTPASPNILNGITRQIVLRILAELNIPHAESNVPLENLTTADEIWVTSSTREVAPVIELNSAPIGTGKPGPIWQQVAKAYAELAKKGD